MIALDSAPPELSIIIPVLNEGLSITTCLHHLQRVAADFTYEVIVVDGDPEGSTVQHLPAEARGIIAPAGRGSQMNAGAKIAQASTLLFLHADTLLPDQAFTQIQKVLQQAPAGAFDLGIDSSRPSLQWIGHLASWRSRLTRIPYGDQAIFIYRSTFMKMGGFPNIPIMEDVALMQALKRHHLPIWIVRDRVLVSPRRWEQEGIIACTLRNWLILSLYYLGVSPNRLWRWYRPQQPSESRRKT